MKIARGRSAFTNRVMLHEVSVGELFKKLKKPEIRRKKDGPYVVLADFRNLAGRGEKPHSLRKGENLVEYYGAALDLDKSDIDLDEIQKRLPRVKYFVYTTYSHQLSAKYHDKGYEPSNRYRVIVPYDKPVRMKEHRELVAYLSSTLGFENIDISQDAISRPMYLPAMHPSNEKKFDYAFRVNAPLFKSKLDADQRFEVLDLLSTLEEEKKAKYDINQTVYEGEGRNDAAAKITGKFIYTGMDNDTLIQAVEAWNEANCQPPLDQKELHTTISSVLDGHARRSDKWGFDELTRRIDKSQPQDFEEIVKLIARTDAQDVTAANREILVRSLARKSKLPISLVKDALKRTQILETEEDEIEEEKKERKTSKELREDFKDWVYVASVDRIFNLRKGILYKPEGFNRMHQHKLQKGAMLSLLLKYECIRQADRLEFSPADKSIYTRNNITYVNTYRPPSIKPVYGEVKVMIDHFKRLLPKKNERDTILDYISFLCQCPGKKVLWMPIIKGGKGIGKSVIVEKILPAVLGEHNVRSVKPKKIASDFNAWQLDTQLVCFPELKLGTTRAEKLHLTEDLKEIITDTGSMASKKGIDDYDIKNRVNLLALTNHEDAVLITEDERRFYLVRSELELQSRRYYNRLHKFLDNNIEAIRYYFLNRDISDFDPHFLPESDYTKEVKENSQLWPNSVISLGLKDPDSFLFQDVATTWSVMVEYVRHNSSGRDLMECENLMHPGSSHSFKLNNAMKELGFRKQPSRMRVKGRLETYWLTPKAGLERPMLKNIRKCLEKQKQIFEFDT